MATDFFYFIGSLPAVSLRGPSPFPTYAAFLGHASGYLSWREMAVLGALEPCPGDPREEPGAPEVLRKWRSFETFLRNALVEFRCRRLKWDRLGDRRECREFLPGILRRLEAVLAEEDPAAREEGLDRIRWEQLDDWGAGHAFDFTAVVVYALRLRILDRRRPDATAADAAGGAGVLDRILDRAAEAAAAARVDEHTA